MASAAAVATNASRSPLPDHEVDDVYGTTGTITGADTNLPDEAPPAVEDGDDDDEDIARPTRRKPAAADLNGVRDDEDEELADENRDAEDELFGSDPEDPLSSPKPRQLDDEELDSGDDEGRNDRLADDDEMAVDDGQQPLEELMFMDVEFGRHPVPEPSDGELYLMKVPRFLAVTPHAFDPDKFQPPVTDHHSKDPPSNTFSAYNAALTTIRWRRSPSNPSQLQSNARLIRWSDGSLTMQLANDPQTQYNVPGFALAPPQVNPRKPTPTSVHSAKRKGKLPFKAANDSFTYLASPSERTSLLRITNKFTTSLKVDPASNATSDALERLQAQLAAAAGSSMGDAESAGIGVVHITEDPELAKKKAEQAEKEKMRAQKRREMQEQRDRERGAMGGRSMFGRRGAGYGGGLTVGGLEDDEELGGGGRGRHSGAAHPRKKPRPNRRGEILTDEEEEYGRRTRTKEDEYDEEDDFVAASDEEEEVGGESDEEDIDEGIDLEATKKTQKGSGGGKKADLDAEGEPDDTAAVSSRATPPDARGRDDEDAGSPVGRNAKRRRIVDEDEDE